MVKMERSDMLGKPAARALSTRLLDQRLLDVSASPRDRFDIAARATVPTAPKYEEVGLTVPATCTDESGRPALECREGFLAISVAPLELQSISGHPMTNRGCAPTEPLSHLTKSGATIDEGLEFLERESSAGRELGLAIGRQPMLFHPVADRRGIAIGQCANLNQR